MNLSFFASLGLVLMTQLVNADTGLWQASPPSEPATLQQGEPAVSAEPTLAPTGASPSQATPAEQDPGIVPFTEDGTASAEEKPASLPPILGERPAAWREQPAVLDERTTSFEGQPAPNVLQENHPALERPQSSTGIRFRNDDIMRTTHESPAAGVSVRIPPRSVPQQWTVTSEDLDQLIKDSVVLPAKDSRVSGQPLRLLDVLSTQHILISPQPGFGQSQPMSRFGRSAVPNVQTLVRGQAPINGQVIYKDPREEQKRVVAYWQLAQSLGYYNLTRQLADFWASISAQPGDEMLLRTAKSSADSSVCEARVALVADQYGLIEAADLVADEGLPLPSDPPHVGTYFTHFEELFANKPVPAVGRRLDATLPLCREVVESRACSTLAAKKSVAFLAGEYAAGRCTFAKLGSTVAQWREEHRAFLRAAYVYNYNICEYVVAVSGIPGDPGTLVTMLIRPTYPVNPESPTQPTEPMPVASETLGVGEPQRLGDDYQTPRSAVQSPTLAPPREDPAVQPASGELPVLQQQPRTIPVDPRTEPAWEMVPAR